MMLSDILNPQSQPAQQAPQGHGRFSGTVMSDEGPIEVRDGVATAGGDTFYVSDDGKYVVDTQKNLVGIIQEGRVIELTQEIADQLRQQGVIASEQPKGMAGQAPL